MVKKISFFLVYFLFISKSTFASTWYKYEKNPILPFSSSISQYYSNASVLYDEGKYKMWVSKYFNDRWVIGYLESNNGITWFEPSTHAVLYPTNENGINETGLFEPFVLKNNQYHLWYNVLVDKTHYIGHAISNDGINWVKDPRLAIIGEKDWEKRGVAHPTVIYVDGKYYLWYAGIGNYGWQLGLATSDDGTNWIKALNNPITLPFNGGHVGGFFVEYLNNLFHIYYHTGSAYATEIYYAISNDGKSWHCPDNDCLILSLNNEGNNKMIISPHLIRNAGKTYLYYTLSDTQNWSIGIASPEIISIPSPTPFISPTPTFLPKTSLIIIPGLFASWNKEAILHNKEIPYNQWKLPYFIHEYDGLIQSLKNLEKKENEDFFIFSYDWRKPLESIADDLKKFIKEKIPKNNDISFVGHSLGGLVSRIYTQKNQEQRVKKIITVGSSHYGTVQVYKPLSAGEIDRENTFIWLAQKLILILNKDSFESDRETIRKKFPVAFDLLPLFNFLVKENDEKISTNSMIIKNPTLSKYNSSFPQIYPILTAIYGRDIQTPSFYKIIQPNAIDNILGNYQDGRPIELKMESGDGAVVSKSAYEKNDDAITFDSLNHGEIIYKKEPIKKILSLLNINFQDNSIIEGKGTKISSSLIFLIRSPATMEVITPDNKKHQEEEGIIFIEDAKDGDYQLKVKGLEKGEYQIIVGKIFDEKDVWEKINGEITSDNPNEEIDNYLINFSQIIPSPTLTLTPILISNQTENQTTPSTNNSINNNNKTNNFTDNQSIKSQSPLFFPDNKNNSSPKLFSQLKKQKEEVKGAFDVKKESHNKIVSILILFSIIFIAIVIIKHNNVFVILNLFRDLMDKILKRIH